MKTLLLILLTIGTLAFGAQKSVDLSVQSMLAPYAKKANSAEKVLDEYFDILDSAGEAWELISYNSKAWVDYMLKIIAFGADKETLTQYQLKANRYKSSQLQIRFENSPYKVLAPQLNVRSAPIIHDLTIAGHKLNQGDRVKLLYRIEISDSDWGYVENGNYKGWVKMRYLENE